jgi:hypothetical protein
LTCAWARWRWESRMEGREGERAGGREGRDRKSIRTPFFLLTLFICHSSLPPSLPPSFQFSRSSTSLRRPLYCMTSTADTHSRRRPWRLV